MVKIVTESEISYCDLCPYAVINKVYTPDSWDDVRKIYCKKLKKDVYTYLDWYDKSDIPKECPFNTVDKV